MEIKKIDDVRYRIEKGAEPGMNTGVTLYASETLLEKIKKDHTLIQATNATTLPGIIGNVLVMPDGHEGYGFPIGGVFASDSENGVISPGSIGFDINCLHPDTEVVDKNGAYHRMCDLEGKTSTHYTLDIKSGKTIGATSILSLKKRGSSILKIQTKCGREILATPDHPLLTQNGMMPAGQLSDNDSVVIYGFRGQRYTKPEHKLVLSESMLIEVMKKLDITDRGNAKNQILNFLRERNLNEIYADSGKLPILIKLIGFVFGDGTIPALAKSPGKSRSFYTSFYGKKEDLEDIMSDVRELGFECAIHNIKRHHHILTRYGISDFDFEEISLKVASSAFVVLIAALGTPIGKKASQPYRIPTWIMSAENWQKRLFLAAFFGAEMTAPKIHKNGYNFYANTFSVNKLESLKTNAFEFIYDFKNLLTSMEVETTAPVVVDGYSRNGIDGKTMGIRLQVLSHTDNLIRFFEEIGYTYNKEKERLASLSAMYLRYLESIRFKLAYTSNYAIEMHNSGTSTKTIVSGLLDEGVSPSFITHSCQGREGTPRVWENAEKFDQFVDKRELGKSGYVYDDIIMVSERPYDGYVYDLTVDNENHNFLANGIVVSNCGVRLIKTNLSEKEVRARITQLSDALFKNVPSGVGSRLNIGLTPKDLEKVAEEGVEFIIRKGFGTEEDIEHTEELGHMVGGDFSKVSQMAKSRGLTELGTLGAGNHFLEVQRVGKLFDQKVAKAYGLYEGQIVVMVHTGSRGFGHQTCSDYLRLLEEYRARKNINLVDKELCYARIGDKEATDYLHAMKCAVNFAFTNRQIITNSIRRSFEDTFGRSSDSMGMELLYDVSHNIAKFEEHEVDGKRTKLYVHRKGATRAFPKGRPEVPEKFRNTGQPVLIPGSMGTASYVLCGKEGSMRETFGSACHGAGRVMSRHQALRDIPASKTFDSLKSKNVEIRIRTRKLVSEEAEWTYKDVDEVVRVVEEAGIAGVVSRNIPMAVIKG